MQDGAVEQVGHRGQPDVRVRPHLMVGSGLHLKRPEIVEEHKRPDRLPTSRRQQAADQKTAAQVFFVSGQFEVDAQGSRSTRVVISVVTVVMSL